MECSASLSAECGSDSDIEALDLCASGIQYFKRSRKSGDSIKIIPKYLFYKTMEFSIVADHKRQCEATFLPASEFVQQF